MRIPIGGTLPASVRHVEQKIAALPRRSDNVFRAKGGEARENQRLSGAKGSYMQGAGQSVGVLPMGHRRWQ